MRIGERLVDEALAEEVLPGERPRGERLAGRRPAGERPVAEGGRVRSRPRDARSLLLAAVLLAAPLLSGCTGATAPGTSPSASASHSAPASPLLPEYPPDPTADSITLETASVAEALARAVGEENIVNDDLVDQTTPATDTADAYYGIIQTLTLDPSFDAAAEARTLVLTLAEAGWLPQETTDTAESYLVALVSGTDPATSWFLIVGADLSVPGQSVMTLQLASPDLP